MCSKCRKSNSHAKAQPRRYIKTWIDAAVEETREMQDEFWESNTGGQMTTLGLGVQWDNWVNRKVRFGKVPASWLETPNCLPQPSQRLRDARDG